MHRVRVIETGPSTGLLLVACAILSIVFYAIPLNASNTSQLERIIEKYGYQGIVTWIVKKQGGATVQGGVERKFMLGMPDLKHVNKSTILADLQRMGSSPQKLAESLSRSAEDWYKKGCSFVASGEPQKALDAFSMAITLNRNHAHAYKNRGVINAAIGKTQNAMQDYDNSIKIAPSDASAFHYRGHLHFLSAEYQEAITDFTCAININPQYEEVYALRGHACYRIGRYEDAIRDYTKVIELNPKDKTSRAYAHGMRGNSYAKIGKYDLALTDYNITVHLTPEDPEAYYSRAVLFGKLGDRKRGFEDLKNAARLGHTEAQKYLTLNGIMW